MKKRNLIAAFLAVLAAVSPTDQSLMAADPAVEQAPLPGGPLLNAGDDFSAWQITYSYASDKPSATGKPSPPPIPAPLRTLTLTRTKPFWHAEAIDISGGKMDQWCNGALRLVVVGDRPPGLPPSGANFAAKFPNFSAISFPDMDWISPSTYVGMQLLGLNKCMVFSKGDMKAWIDLETRFPVSWQLGSTETRTFRQLPPPDGMLTLPPDVSKVFASLNHDLDLMRRPVPN